MLFRSRGKFVDRTEELTRLRRELGERHRGSTGGAVGGTAKYEEIVGPVIEEYEKTIAAMEHAYANALAQVQVLAQARLQLAPHMSQSQTCQTMT